MHACASTFLAFLFHFKNWSPFIPLQMMAFMKSNKDWCFNTSSCFYFNTVIINGCDSYKLYTPHINSELRACTCWVLLLLVSRLPVTAIEPSKCSVLGNINIFAFGRTFKPKHNSLLQLNCSSKIKCKHMLRSPQKTLCSSVVLCPAD